MICKIIIKMQVGKKMKNSKREKDPLRLSFCFNVPTFMLTNIEIGNEMRNEEGI